MGQVYITQGHCGEQVEGYASSFSPQSDGALWTNTLSEAARSLVSPDSFCLLIVVVPQCPWSTHFSVMMPIDLGSWRRSLDQYTTTWKRNRVRIWEQVDRVATLYVATALTTKDY